MFSCLMNEKQNTLKFSEKKIPAISCGEAVAI